jgi:hypothetical protein
MKQRPKREIPRVSANDPVLSWYPWNPSRFHSETLGWPFRAKGVYRELKDLQWQMKGLPSGAQRLRELVGAGAGDWREAWPLLEPLFPVWADGLRRNHYLEEVRAHAKDVSAKRSAAGKQGARGLHSKKGLGNHDNVVPIAMAIAKGAG